MLTSNTIDNPNPAKCALGVHYELQMKIFDRLLKYLEEIKFSGQNRWQNGMILTIKGTIELHKNLRDNYGIPYLLTSNITQDYLERKFGNLRALGGQDDNPSALQFLFRLQKDLTSTFLEVDNCRLI